MSTSRDIKNELRAEEAVKADAEHALDLFEGTRNEEWSKEAEEKTIEAAEHAEEVLKRRITDEDGIPDKFEERELKDMEKVVVEETRAARNAGKNYLFFEDHASIRAEEAAADAVSKAEQDHDKAKAEIPHKDK